MDYKLRNKFGFEFYSAVENMTIDSILSGVENLKFSKRNSECFIYFRFKGTDFRVCNLHSELPNTITHKSQLSGILWDNFKHMRLEYDSGYSWNDSKDWCRIHR